MTYFNSEFFLGVPPQDFDGVPFQPAGFDGTFTLLDGELVYIVPSGKQGTVNVSIQYREDDGTALVDESGNPLLSFADTISVAGTPASTSIGNVLISGQANPVTGTEYTYTATADGDAGNLTYAWSTSPTTSTIDEVTGTNTADITFDADNTYDVICTITSGDSNPTDSPKTTTVQRTSNAPASGVDGGLAPDAWTPFVATDFGNSGVTGGITSADERYYVRPTARFMTQPIVEHGSSSREVKVIAHPYNGIDTDETAIGIDRVDFYVNGGAAQSVTTPATETGPTGEDELVYTFSVPGNLSQDLSSVRAVVYPNKGRIRVLQGTQYYKASDAEAFFGKYSRDEDFYSLEVDSSDILLNASEPYQWTCTSNVDNVGVSQGTDFDMSEIQVIYGTHDPASSNDVVKFTFTTEAGRDSWIENYNTTLYDQDLPTPNVTYVLADNGSNEWTITWTNGYASDVAASFYNDYDVLNSEQTFTLGWNPPESYSGGYWSAERGVLMQTPQATYHISPTGDDSTGDGSVGNPYETALGAYEAAGNTSSNYIIDNTAYSSQNGALNFSDFIAQWPGRSGWTGNTPVPIVKGGTVIGVPKSSSTSLQSVGSIPTDEEVPLGFIMDGVDIRPHASTYSGSDDLAATSYSLSGGGTDEMNCLRIMLTGCDIGPESLSDLEAQVAAPTGLFSSAFGIYLEMKGCGDSSPIWSDGNVIRYSHYKRLQESVNDKYIGQGAADIGNSNLQALNHIKDVNAWLYPWGPVGEATFCLKGQFDSMVTKTVVNGIDNTSVVDASDAFYDLLGPTSVQGNFIPNPSYLTDNGNGTYTLIASGIDQTLADAWNDIAEANNCLIPPVVYDNAKIGTAPFVRRTNVDVSAITDPANWSALTGTPNYSGFFQSGTDITGVTDPHLDIQQSFWNSQFRVPGLNEALKDKQYLGNTVAANIKIEGETNVFQGIFHSDASAIIESGFWNLEWEKDTSNDTSLLSLQWGHPGQEYGGPGVHVGPNLTRPSGDIFRVRPFFQQAEIPAGQITIYDIEGQRFVEGGGSIADQFSDWPALVPPETNEVVMTGTEAGAAAPVYYWSNTTSDPLVSLGSMSFTYSGSGTNSLSYTEVTDDSGVSGVYAAQGRYNPADPSNSPFDGQVIIGTTLKLGPGYSDSGSILVDGGIYDTPTYAYTANDSPKTLDWINALSPGGISVVVTVERSGQQFQGFATMSDLASENQGGYLNLSLSKLGNFIASYQAGDVVTVECFILPSPTETILDTFTIAGGAGPTWRSSNSWWNGWHTSGGTWSSTGTLEGDYITIESGSQLRTNAFRLGEAGGTALPANAKVRVTFTSSASDSGTSSIGADIGGDVTFYWDDGPFTSAEIEESGTFGWNKADDITIEIFTS